MESNFCINLFHSRIYIHNSRYPAFTLVVTFAVFHCIKLSLLLNFKLVLEIEPASKSICSKEITTFCNPGYCRSITRRAVSQLRATINVITNWNISSSVIPLNQGYSIRRTLLPVVSDYSDYEHKTSGFQSLKWHREAGGGCNEPTSQRDSAHVKL